MSAELSQRIGELVIPATVQCTTPETTGDDLRTLTVYGAWTPDEHLQYTGTTMQSLYMPHKQPHKRGRNANVSTLTEVYATYTITLCTNTRSGTGSDTGHVQWRRKGVCSVARRSVFHVRSVITN